jgi:hypothetical protein
MKTYPDINEEGVLTSFEISSSLAGPKMIAHLIEKQLGGKITNRRKWFSGNEVHLRFIFLGKEFVVWEPFGDNSRYTICPADEANIDPDLIEKVQEGFKKFHPGILGLITGFLQI